MKTERAAREISGIPPGYQPIAVVDQVQLSVGLDPWLGLRGLAGYCALSRRTLQALVNDPDDPIPSYRVGGRLLVRRSEFDAWMARRRNTKAQALASLADAMLREVQHESNTESGGQASQPRDTRGSARTPRKPGAGRVQNGGLKGPLLATKQRTPVREGVVLPEEAASRRSEKGLDNAL